MKPRRARGRDLRSFYVERAMSKLGEFDAHDVEDARQRFAARVGRDNFEALVRWALAGREVPPGQ